MNNNIYESLPVPSHLRPFVHRISLANCIDSVDIVSPAKPTGATFLGWLYGGHFSATHNDENVMPTHGRFLHLSGQLREERINLHYHGQIGHLLFHFTALGAYQLFGLTGTDLNARALVANTLPQPMQELEQQLLEAIPENGNLIPGEEHQHYLTIMITALEALIDVANPVPPYLLEAQRLIDAADGTCRVADIANAVSVSPRQLNREFNHLVGLSPKYYCRVLQINRALQAMLCDDQPYMTDIAHQANFSDQAHFCRVFREFLDVSPSEFLNGDESMLSHFLGDPENRSPRSL